MIEDLINSISIDDVHRRVVRSLRSQMVDDCNKLKDNKLPLIRNILIDICKPVVYNDVKSLYFFGGMLCILNILLEAAKKMKRIEIVEKFVTEMGGKKLDRLNIWNACDDDPKLTHARFELPTPDGIIKISAYEQKQETVWPDYPCSGDTYRNKFHASLDNKNLTDGFVDINIGNLQAFLDIGHDE